MILGFDVGNTHICPTFFKSNGEIIKSFRIPSKNLLTEDSLFVLLKSLADYENINLKDVEDIVISSVVPHLNEIFMFLSDKYFNVTPKYVSLKNVSEDKLKIQNRAERSLGADRIVNILAATKKYKNRHLAIIDFGTATTFEIVYNNEYLGGCILPGIELSINALFQNTAKLPKVRFNKPTDILANTTFDQINAGIYYGNIGAIKELIHQYKKIYKDLYVIATGGQGLHISKEVSAINKYIKTLGEEGIFEFYTLNK